MKASKVTLLQAQAGQEKERHRATRWQMTPGKLINLSEPSSLQVLITEDTTRAW